MNTQESDINNLPATRSDCPCPKKKCKRHGLCTACREHHKRLGPYCQR